jgi:ADP-heptose:LPS heptosyltransferase
VILRPLGLGDFLTAVPAIRAIARHFPVQERWLAAPAVLQPLARLAGGVHQVVDTHPLQPLPGSCGSPQVAIDLHGRGPASHRILLQTRPQRLIAFANRDVPGTEAFPAWRDEEHEVHRWCRLLGDSGVAADPGDLDIAAPLMPAPSFARGATVVHPGAAYPARRWPADRWARVARSFGAAVVITGGSDERELGLSVAQAAGIDVARVVAGRTDLLELAAIVAAARLVISTDTGIAHLATALRTPSVILFGPTSPALWGPPLDRPWHRVIWKGRVGNANAGTPDAGLLDISVDEVLAEAAIVAPARSC